MVFGGSRFLLVFFVFLCEYWWFLVIFVGSWCFFNGFWWFLVVLGGSWQYMMVVLVFCFSFFYSLMALGGYWWLLAVIGG